MKMSNTQLIEAVVSGNTTEVERMVKDGHDVNQHGTEQEWTALNYAAGKGNLEMLHLLLGAGADPFLTGRDKRTPYMIALAAGQVDACRILRTAEEKAGGDKDCVSSRAHENRRYCKAYELRNLRNFPGWSEQSGDADDAEPLTDDSVVFVHQDLTVTRSMWHDQDVIFSTQEPNWEEFCTNVLKFKVPHDFDLVPTGN